MVVYRHRRNDTLEIFYVGIGKEEKRAYSTKGRNPHWKRIVNKYGYTVDIIATPDTWVDCCKLEQLLIETYGRRDLGTGKLVNLTSGGDGIVGYIYSDETKHKMSEFRKGKKHSDDTKQKIGKVHKGKKLSVETKQKISKGQKGKKISEDTKAKIGAARKGKKFTDEHKQKIGEAQKGKKMSEESKQKMSKAQQGAKHNRAKLTEQQAYEIKYCNFNSAQEKIAFIYGVSIETVSHIRNNHSWKHI